MTLESVQPIFIVGTPKSGTTFLLSLFDSHPNVISLLETAVYHLPLRGLSNRRDLVSRLQAFYGRLMSQHTIHAGATSEKIAQALAGLDVEPSTPDLARRIWSMFVSVVAASLPDGARDRVTHVIEKTPRHYDAVDGIVRDFPTAKILHVLRDPRDNYVALKRMMDEAEYRGIGYQPTNFMRDRLLASLESAYANVDKYPGQYRLVYYEQLIREGEPVIREIAAWLGLGWHEALLIPSYGGELWRGNSLAPDLKDRLKPFDQRPIGRWKDSLSEQEVIVLEWIIEAYRLEREYPLTRSADLRRRLWALARPFPGEWRWAASFGRMNPVKRVIEAVRWNYLSRRTWIAGRLLRRQRSADTRLTTRSLRAPLLTS
jgi:hypothetical protein